MAGGEPEPQVYATGLTRRNIEFALRGAGKDPESLLAADLVALEDFHTLGRIATLGLVGLAGIKSEDRVLDAGTGIGGAARLIAGEIGAHVSAVDLTAEYCEVARWLNGAVGLAGRIDVRQADVVDLPFEPGSFDVVISQHVQMNIADKTGLYAEARRVLVPGGRLALWDVTAGPEQPIRFPVPWALSAEQSHLVTPVELRALVEQGGFEVRAWNDLTEPAAGAMQAFLAAPQGPIGLHVFVPDFAVKAANLVENARENRLRFVQAVLVAR